MGQTIQNKQTAKVLVLFLSLIFLISFISAKSDFGYNYLSQQSSIQPGNVTYNITNNYYNQTVNATVNSTQFSNNSPITINLSWLTNFIQSVVNAMGFGGSVYDQNLNRTANVSFISITANTTGTRWECSNATDIVIGNTTGECT